ncbi:hypothetical protein D3C86_1751620 [compost metagenome]
MILMSKEEATIIPVFMKACPSFPTSSTLEKLAKLKILSGKLNGLEVAYSCALLKAFTTTT